MILDYGNKPILDCLRGIAYTNNLSIQVQHLGTRLSTCEIL